MTARTNPDGFPWTDSVKIAAGQRYIERHFGQHDWHVQRWRVFLKDLAAYERMAPAMEAYARALKAPAGLS